MNSVKRLTENGLLSRLRTVRLELAKHLDRDLRQESGVIEDRLTEIRERRLAEANFDPFNPDGN